MATFPKTSDFFEFSTYSNFIFCGITGFISPIKVLIETIKLLGKSTVGKPLLEILPSNT